MTYDEYLTLVNYQKIFRSDFILEKLGESLEQVNAKINKYRVEHKMVKVVRHLKTVYHFSGEDPTRRDSIVAYFPGGERKIVLEWIPAVISFSKIKSLYRELGSRCGSSILDKLPLVGVKVEVDHWIFLEELKDVEWN